MAKALSTSLTEEREQLFVGRTDELRAMRDWLNDANPESRVVAVTGMGGIGKSTLLIRLLQLALEGHAVPIWVDGRACYRTPKGFWDALPPEFRTWHSMVADRPKLVIAVDNFEEIQVLEGWLRNVFMASLPATGVLFLVASRTDLIHTWVEDPVWQDHVEVWRLEGLSAQEVDQFLIKHQVRSSEQIADLAGTMSRHPLTLALTVDAIHRGNQQTSHEIRHLIAETVSARLIRELTDPELEPLVDVLSLVRDANQDLLQRILGYRISARQYHALRQLSFVRRTQSGVALHDMAQGALYDDLRQRDPGSFWTIRRQALEVLLEEYDRVPQAKQGAIAQQLLWVCRDIYAPLTAYADLTTPESHLVSDHYGPQDRETVRHFVASWGRQSFPVEGQELMNLVDDVIDHYPGTIRMTRDAQGVAEAMFCVLPVHRGTLELLQRYQPLVVTRLVESGLGVTWCEPDASNVSYNILIGINMDQTRYSPQQLIGAIARDQFSMHASLLGLLLITNPDFKAFLHGVGYQSMPFPILEEPGPPEELFMLDLRRQHFTGWIRAIAGLEPTKTGLLKPLSLTDLSATLEQLGEIHPVDGDSQEIRDRILTLLHSTPPAAPLTLRDQRVLSCSYLPRRQSATACASALHISRATYYRYLNTAVSHLLAGLSRIR